jgi:hypothetical protein
VLITKDFVFVHLPKTGGTFIERICQEHMETIWLEPDDRSAGEVPKEYAHLPKIAFIRNPWDWYVSWYHFIHDSDPEAWEKMFGSEDVGFPEAVRKACTFLGRFDLYTRQWRATFRIAQLHGVQVDVGKTENLREDFIAFLDRHEIEGDRLREAVLETPAINQSKRGHYRDYYDDELRDLVGEKGRRIVREYGYEF